MYRTSATLLCISLAALLCACRAKETTAQSEDVHARDADGDPIYRKNPHPKQAYRITMTIEDAPGPFGSVSGTAFYDMTNRDECAPFDPALGMSTKPKEDAIPVTFHRVDDTAYMAMVYTDGMVDADYYGKGICNWEFGGIGVSLKATGSSAETAFAPSLEKKYGSSRITVGAIEHFRVARAGSWR